MRSRDLLWKGIIEDLAEYFIQFFLPQANELIDYSRGIEFLDKELEAIFPAEEQSPRYVDKLIKVFTNSGQEEWILIHVEVQGYQDQDFGRRMYTYFSRLYDRYSHPITAIAIFTDENPTYRPGAFSYSFAGTTLAFTYNTYKILDQDEALLAEDANPFALVVLTALVAIKHKKLEDEQLLGLKVDLFRRMHARRMPKATMKALAIFLKLYVHFSKSETNLTFDKEILSITKQTETMGIEELAIKLLREESREEGREMGREEGQAGVVKHLIHTQGLNDAQIANITGLSLAFIAKVRASLEQAGLS